jgi:two-component system sensor histidine kinase RegB
MLRWFAISGQMVAIVVAVFGYGVDVPLGPAFFLIGLSTISNTVVSFIYPEGKRLRSSEVVVMVVFDVTMLSGLLYLTGGLHNPFSVLLLGPITVAASAAGFRSTIFVGCVTILQASFLSQFSLELFSLSGQKLYIPDIFVFGNWVALMIAVVFFGTYSARISHEMRSMSDALAATQLALSREQKLTDLGGVVAAAAHELGSPLATIKLASAELIDDLVDHPELREDAILIRSEADRCRDILRDMGRAGKDDLHMRQAPVSAVLQEAANPHSDRGTEVKIDAASDASTPMIPQPVIMRQPEIIHGLRNLVQNAVDFADSRVRLEIRWTDKMLHIRVMDDGPGFPPQILGRLGDPFARSKRDVLSSDSRPGYEGMGLGLFIAKTLLERSGAELVFGNGSPLAKRNKATKTTTLSGALVHVSWPLDKITPDSAQPVTGPNRHFHL